MPPPTPPHVPRRHTGTPSSDSALAALVARAKEGDRDAVDEITRRYRAAIVRHIEIMIATNAPLMVNEVEDVAQEVFADLDRKLAGYEETGFFLAWLKGVANNIFNGKKRTFQRRVKNLGEDTLSTSRDVAPSQSGSLFTTKKETLRAGVKTLAPADREAWELYAEGWKPAAIATELGVDRNAVYQRLDRARKQLTEWLEAKYGMDGSE